MRKKKEALQPAVIFQPGDLRAEIGDATSVLDIAIKNQIDLSHSCGGMGSCTTCRILIESDLCKLSPRNEIEQEIATIRNFRDDERLACQLEPHNGLIARLPASRK